MLGWEGHLLRQQRSPATVETWGVYARKFGAFLEDQGVDAPELLSRAVLRAWQDDNRVSLRSPAAQQVAVTAVKNVLHWADGEELLARPGIWAYLERPRVGENLPRPLREEDLARIVEYYARPTRELERLRDRALFWFLVTTGSRITAALAIRTDQVQGRGVIVRQKGGNEHLLVMSASAQEWVGDYLRRRGRDDVPELWIYIGERGRRPLHDYQANRIWSALSRRLRVPRFTSHVLKHTSASELGDVEPDNQRVSDHIGWKDPRMMKRYRELRGGVAARAELVDRLDSIIRKNAPPASVIVLSRRRRRPSRKTERPA